MDARDGMGASQASHHHHHHHHHHSMILGSHNTATPEIEKPHVLFYSNCCSVPTTKKVA
jgi:hypothetical protein